MNGSVKITTLNVTQPTNKSNKSQMNKNKFVAKKVNYKLIELEDLMFLFAEN